jgi:hypothetical protein
MVKWDKSQVSPTNGPIANNTTTSDADHYLLNYPSPICPKWYACTLHIDLTNPLGYPVTGATHGEGGTPGVRTDYIGFGCASPVNH